jgi:hypothetical protein
VAASRFLLRTIENSFRGRLASIGVYLHLRQSGGEMALVSYQCSRSLRRGAVLYQTTKRHGANSSY